MKYFPTLYPIKLFFFLITIISFSFAQQNKIEIQLAEQLSRTGDYESARTIFGKHYKNGNKTPNVINGLDLCLKELNLVEERIVFLKEVTAFLPSSFNYAVDLGSAYHLNQQTDLAMETWEEVYSFEPSDIMRYRRVAMAMTNIRLFDEAIDVYKQALAKLKNQGTLNLDIANLYRAQLDYKNATYHFLEYFMEFKKRASYVRSQLISMAQNDDAVDRIINSIENHKNNNDPDIRELLSNLYMRKKDYKNALEIILEIEGSVGDNNFVYLNRFANEALKDRAYDYVINAYEFILNNLASKSIPAIELKLADAYYLSGGNQFNSGDKVKSENKIKRAQRLLQNLIEKKTAQKYLAHEKLGDIQKQYYNDLDEALKSYSQIDLKRINKAEADRVYFKIADIYVLKNQLSNALSQYQKVTTRDYISNAKFNIAEIDYFQGQFSMAKEKYNTLLGQVGMRDTLANNIMDRLFEMEMFLNDGSSFAEYAKAHLLKRQLKYSEAAGKFSEIFHSGKSTSYYAAMHAAMLYNQLNKIPEANTILEQVIEVYPQEEQIDYAYFLLANNYRIGKNMNDALILYKEILVQFPTSLYGELARNYARDLNAQIKENLN